ncbi:bifunctional precorrin-2 dehydrogenase/sirohydrochlorin ferrochelatase [Evansella sp. AB-rgal1]|uniref:precorrin-2 dehydrogenase/sirohydrochlorin ferrochelatase family protein n=1 Tax=Evansella sp. AB-rgal1 TaxID=3242696 RepID=UPI00359D987D
MSNFTPCMVKLANKDCVVIGGGKVAARKVISLLHAKCHVKVISPELCSGLKEIIDQCTYEKRMFQKDDTRGAFLVVAATNSKAINMEIYKESVDSVPFLNIVDDQQLSNFFLPSVVERGPLQIAISTTGTSPLVTKNIKQKVEALFGPEYEPYLKIIGELRKEIIETVGDSDEKKRLLLKLSSEELLVAFQENDAVGIDNFISDLWN